MNPPGANTATIQMFSRLSGVLSGWGLPYGRFSSVRFVVLHTGGAKIVPDRLGLFPR